jgi:acyl-CoA hydrolase
MTVLMTPDMANFSGNVHGGAILKILDQVAYACASNYAHSYVVTLSVDRVLFRDAIDVGDLVASPPRSTTPVARPWRSVSV